MATANDYIEHAARYIGVSGTDNEFNTWIWGRHVYDPYTYPWCAAFQSYVGVHDLGMPFNPSASASGVAWQGDWVDASDVQPGDWVLFDWDGRGDFGWADHIGLVEWFDHYSGYFGTIEGNTGGGEGSVMRCTRGIYNGYSTAFFRPPYSGESEEDMLQPIDVWAYKNEALNGNADAYALLTGAARNSAEAAAQVAALTEAVKELAKSKGVDPDATIRTIDKAVRDCLSKLKISVKAS